jgi:hypothetical protein
MRFWKRRSQSSNGASSGTPRARLEAIDESTPHRYRFWLADAGDRDAAVAVLRDPRRIPLTFEVADEPDGRIRFDVAAAGNGRGQSIISVLYSLNRAEIRVRGFDALDVIDDLDEADLVAIVERWREVANNGPTRSRMERLGGDALLDACLRRLIGSPRANHYRAAIMDISFNTPGCEGRLIRAAAEIAARPMGKDDNDMDTHCLLSSASSRATLSDYAGITVDYPEDALLALADRPGLVGMYAVAMLGSLPAALSATTTATLMRIAQLDDEDQAAAALRALRQATPMPELRILGNHALESRSNEVRASALSLLAYHWGTEARPAWREFLASKSTTLRDAAEGVIAEHGTEEDLEDAALRVAKIIRAKPGMSYSPPRASDLIGLLARYREHPVARSAFDDLAARWDRFPDPELRDWIREHHPWIEPSGSGDPPVELDIAPETPGEPDPPTVERTDDGFSLVFDDVSAHSAARERLEELLGEHPSVEVLESDREWIDIRIAADDPEAVIARLWAQAVTDAQRD